MGVLTRIQFDLVLKQQNIYPFCMMNFENRSKTYAYDRLFKNSVFTKDTLDFNLDRQSHYL